MDKKQWAIFGGLFIIFIIGAVYIVMQGRPVVQMQQDAENEEMQVEDADAAAQGMDTEDEDENDEQEEDDADEGTTSTQTDTSSNQADSGLMGTYTMADVQSHSTSNDCWAAVNTNVYDLSTWVSRHPGGSSAIKALCGTDATAQFTNVHGKNKAAISALALLKIGTLE